jgi:hypothetical protein
MPLDIDAFFAPYVPTPVGSPPRADADGDIPMDDVNQSPDLLPQYTAAQKGKGKQPNSPMNDMVQS